MNKLVTIKTNLLVPLKKKKKEKNVHEVFFLKQIKNPKIYICMPNTITFNLNLFALRIT